MFGRGGVCESGWDYWGMSRFGRNVFICDQTGKHYHIPCTPFTIFLPAGKKEQYKSETVA